SRRIRPGRLLGDVEVTGLVVIAAPMPYDGAPRLLLTRDRQVLLAALAAEGQREKQLVRLTRDPSLIVARDAADTLRFKGNEDRVALRQELVQPEGAQIAAL